MRLYAMSEAGMNRRGFMQRTGGALLSTLLGRGVPEALAKTMAANPTKPGGYLVVNLVDGAYGVDADAAIGGAESLASLLGQLGISPSGMSGGDVVVPVTGEQYARVLEYADADYDNHYMELPNGWAVGLDFNAEMPKYKKIVPTNLNDLVNRAWEQLRGMGANSNGGDYALFHNVDELKPLAKKYGFKPPDFKDEITGIGRSGHGAPKAVKAPVKRRFRNWDEFDAWQRRQNELSGQAHDGVMKWLDDGKELTDKRWERRERGEPDIRISDSHEGGMHQSFEAKLRAALCLI